MAKLKWGSKGSAVKALQEKLNRAGAKPKLTVDGVFGKKTFEAVKAYQKSTKTLKVDGVAGDKTLGALDGKGAGGKDAKAPALKWDIDDPKPRLRDVQKNARENKKAALSMMKALAKADRPELDVLRAKIDKGDEQAGAVVPKMVAVATKLVQHRKSFDAAVKAGKDKDAAKTLAAAKKLAQEFRDLDLDYDVQVQANIDLHKQADAALQGKADKDHGIEWPYPLYDLVQKDDKAAMPGIEKALKSLAERAEKHKDTKEGAALVKKAAELKTSFAAIYKARSADLKALVKIQKDFEKVAKADPKKGWALVGKAKPLADKIGDRRDAWARWNDGIAEVRDALDALETKRTKAAAGT